jgi:AraC family transcriptional regulator
VDIIPAGVDCRWDMSGPCRHLVLSISQKLLNRMLQSRERNPGAFALRNRFNLRNVKIQHIGWAMKTEMEEGCPNGPLFLESMATALALEILRDRGVVLENGPAQDAHPSSRIVKRLLAYIESHLGANLTLEAIAKEMQVSVSSLKHYARQSLGAPLHQYVLRRRIERAAQLLAQSKLPTILVALETGFSHQSHMAKQMRRLLGVSPKELRR